MLSSVTWFFCSTNILLTALYFLLLTTDIVVTTTDKVVKLERCKFFIMPSLGNLKLRNSVIFRVFPLIFKISGILLAIFNAFGIVERGLGHVND